MKYTIEDLTSAMSSFCSLLEVKGELERDSWREELDSFIFSYINPVEVKEETIPITLASIRNTCGWSKYCDVTGGNHYMLNESSVEDYEIFHVKISDAKKLNLIK